MTDLEMFPFTLTRPECRFAYCPHHDTKKGDSPCLVGCVSPREHETGKLDCWCGPKIQELANGNRVIVHRDVAERARAAGRIEGLEEAAAAVLNDGWSCDCLGYKERGMVNPNCIEHNIIPDAVDAIRSRIKEIKEE